MADPCIIFDVDGVLLELSSAEEDVFFAALAPYVGGTSLSRNWNSYRIRNDENIIAEVLERHGHPRDLTARVIADYLTKLDHAIGVGEVTPTPISGAAELLAALAPTCRLGIATANLRTAAELRLRAVGLWHPVSELAIGADGGGHKHEILGRALAACATTNAPIIYIGDNLNDLIAAQTHDLPFIGFSTDPKRRDMLVAAGAHHTATDHQETYRLIKHLLDISPREKINEDIA
jgi:HAD superfamily hydrolase (TIGR01549 family)